MKKLVLIFLILIIFSTFTLNSFAIPTDKFSSSKIFEYNYTNNAWAHVNKGWYITSKGTIIKYKEENGSIAENNVGKINQRELYKYIRLMCKCSKNELSKKDYVGADMGLTTYSGYLPSKKITLYVTGDYKQYNLASEAKIIVKWLDNINTKMVQNVELIRTAKL